VFEIKELFELGFHYGHRKWRSNPKMNEFIFCEKWGISIIDLSKTVPLFEKALNAIYDCVRKGGKVLFVGTKHQAKDQIAKTASECHQFYVNKRWLGGTITNNFSTIQLPLNKLTKMEKNEESGYINKFTKKERLDFSKKKDKLLGLLQGIRNLHGNPNMLVVVDPKREDIAVKEARLHNIPVIALADTDTPEPSMIKYIVPGNDEGVKVIDFFLARCQEAINQALLDLKEEQESNQKKKEAKEEAKKEAAEEVKKESSENIESSSKEN